MLIQEQLFEPEVNFGSYCGSRPRGGGKNRPVKRRGESERWVLILDTEAATECGEEVVVCLTPDTETQTQ